MTVSTKLVKLAAVLSLMVGACATDDGLDDVTADGADPAASSEAAGTSETAQEAVAPPPPAAVSAADLAALSAFTEGAPPDVEECLIDTIGTDPDLARALKALESDEITDLALDDQLTVFELTGDCAGAEVLGELTGQSFAEGADLEAAPGVGSCLGEAMVADDGPLVMAGFAGLETPGGVPPEARDALIETMTKCIPGTMIGNIIATEATSDPELAGAVDPGCVRRAYLDVDIEPLWTAFVDTSGTLDFGQLPPDLEAAVMGPLLGCISFGAVLAEELAASEVELSESTVACLDDEFRSSNLISEILAGGEPNEEQLGLIMFSCLTPDELSQALEAG